MRVITVLDAIDFAVSDVPLRNGSVLHMNYPVWDSAVLSRQAVFRIPQDRVHVWVTNDVVAAYLGSGCEGIFVGGPVGEVR